MASSSNLITFDSPAAAARFAPLDWIQAGLSIANLRKVNAVGGNSISVQGAAVSVALNDRIFVIGRTQVSTVGGSASYIQPNTVIRQRDDDSAAIFTNSTVTSNSDGLVRWWSEPALYDVLLQDGNQTLQGYIADLAVGAVEGVSAGSWAFFGATATFHANAGFTGDVTIGGSLTVNGAVGVTGWATFGSTLTANANAGITGTLAVGGAATFGSTVTLQGNLTGVSVTGAAVFGSTITGRGALGISEAAVFGATVTINGNVGFIQGTSDFNARRFNLNRAHLVGGSYFVLSGWGATASVTVTRGSVDQAGQFFISTGGTTYSSNPTINHLARDGDWIHGAGSDGPMGVLIGARTSPTVAAVPIYSSGAGDLGRVWVCGVTPSSGQVYQFNWAYFGTSSL